MKDYRHFLKSRDAKFKYGSDKVLVKKSSESRIGQSIQEWAK